MTFLNLRSPLPLLQRRAALEKGRKKYLSLHKAMTPVSSAVQRARGRPSNRPLNLRMHFQVFKYKLFQVFCMNSHYEACGCTSTIVSECRTKFAAIRGDFCDAVADSPTFGWNTS
jgi:hypothetical protein